MSPLDARLSKLASDLRREWDQVRLHAQRAASVDPSRGEPEAALVALSLDHAYQAFESLLIRLERGLGLPERGGATWHAQLLFEAADPIPGLRPAVYPAEVELEWDALRRFRHFLRHAYAVALDPEKLCASAERLARAIAASEPLVRGLLDALSEGET